MSGLTNGRSYTFEVRAVNALGASEAAAVRAVAGRFDRVTGLWLEGFAGTVAGHLLERVHERLAAPRRAGARVRLAGRAMDGAGVASAPADAWSRDAPSRWRHLRSTGGEAGGHRGARALTGRDLLTAGTAFELTGGAPHGGSTAVWASAAWHGFARGADGVSLDGGAGTALLGADHASGRWTTGLALAHSRGDARYSGSGRGEVESSLTALHPYVAHALSDRLSVWGAAGYGTGTLRLAPAGGVAVETGIDLAMAALGARATLRPAVPGRLGLALESDALWLRAGSDAAPGLAAGDVGVTRVRLGLEGTQTKRFRRRSTLTRRFELGLRHDAGEAEGGVGADIGGGLSLRNASGALALDLSGRMVLAHADGDLREWAVAGSMVLDPRPGSRRGLSLSVRPSVGASAADGAAERSGWEAVAGREPHTGAGGRRLDAELAYGVALSGGPLVGVPHAGLGLSDTGREYTLGWRLEWARPSRGQLADLGVSVRRRHGAGRAHEDRIGLGLALRW